MVLKLLHLISVIKALEDEIKSHKQIHEKIISEFESERLVLKNMVTVTDSVMEDQKSSLNKVISAHLKTINTLQEEITASKELVEVEKNNCLTKLKEKETAFETLFEDLIKVRKEKENLEIKLESEINCFHNKVTQLTVEKGSLHEQMEKYKKGMNLTIKIILLILKVPLQHRIKQKTCTFLQMFFAKKKKIMHWCLNWEQLKQNGIL